MVVTAGAHDGGDVFGEKGEEVTAMGEGVGDDMARDRRCRLGVGGEK